MLRLTSPKYRLLRWWARLDLPRTRELLRDADVWKDPLWKEHPDALCKGRWHGYTIKVDVSHYHQRGVYFHGRLFDVPLQLAIIEALRPGDLHLDGGAHVGMTAMLAAYRVGKQGRVLAFEPNPDIYARLRWHVETNALTQIETFPFALSDHDDTATLVVPSTGNTGAATLGKLPARLTGGPKRGVGAAYDVALRRGDEVLDALHLDANAPMFIKLDVEGHEVALLMGMHETLKARRPAVLLECNVEMLPQNGSSVDALFGIFEGLGYQAYWLDATWSRVRRRFRLVIGMKKKGWRPAKTVNVLFMMPEGVHEERLRAFVKA